MEHDELVQAAYNLLMALPQQTRDFIVGYYLKKGEKADDESDVPAHG